MQGSKKAYDVNVGYGWVWLILRELNPPNKSSRNIYQSYNRQELVLYSIC